MKLSIDHTACPELFKWGENRSERCQTVPARTTSTRMIIQVGHILKSEVEYNPRKNSFFFPFGTIRQKSEQPLKTEKHNRTLRKDLKIITLEIL